MLFKSILLCMILGLFAGCSNMGTLNLKSHEFGERPARIVWLQIAGFTEEHLALLRFGMGDSSQRTSMEEVSCVGKMWNYNLYDLRPKPYTGFMSQLIGSPNIKGGCEDYKNRPVWSYLSREGFRASVFESGVDEKYSLEMAWKCEGADSSFKDDLILWRMNAPVGKNAKTFHYQERKRFDGPGVYYDKSCQKKSCYSSLSNNVKSVYNRFEKRRYKSIFILKDFSFYNALINRKISQAREILSEIEKILAFFLNEIDKKNETLVILSSTSSRNIEFPRKGRQWREFELKGKNIIYHRPSLISSVFANGPGAENFCGIFEENEMLKRIIWTPKKVRFRLW